MTDNSDKPNSINSITTVIEELQKVYTNDFITEIAIFQMMMSEISSKVVTAAMERKKQNKPSMTEQGWQEHIEHMEKHLDFWKQNNIGDEDSTLEQARHTLCRAMLAYFAYSKEFSD